MARKEGNILIVDDNDDLLIALRLFLSRHFLKIDTIRNPNLILSTLEKSSYDIILLDIVMPRLDGVGTIQQLKAQGC